MFRYFIKSLFGNLRTGKSLHLLSIVGVALGVASVISIRLISNNAISAFAGTVRAVSGNADVTVLGADGFLPDTAFVALLSTPGVLTARPTFRVYVTPTDGDQSPLELLGVDMFAPTNVPIRESDTNQPIDLDGWIAVTPQRARMNDWQVGDRITVSGAGAVAELTIGALVDYQASDPSASSGLAIMDIAQAQHLFGGIGRIHQIDVSARSGTNVDTLAARIQNRLGPSVRTVTPENRVSEATDLLAGFRLNLTALSLVSVFVGLFLVYSSTQAGLVRRRTEHGILRCLGASRAQLVAMVLCEVGALGVIGTAAGIPLGYWAAASRIDVVNSTITNLYLLQAIERVTIDTSTLVFALAAGLGGAIAGALIPALDISRRDTRSLLAAYVLRDETAQWAPKLLGVGALVALVGLGCYAIAGQVWRPSGFVLAFTVVTVLPLVTPIVLDRATRKIRVRSFGWSLSVKTLAAHLHTTSLTVAGLGVAVTILVGVTVMVSSFRVTLTRWIDSTVNADIYVAAASGTPGLQGSSITDAFVNTMAANPEVVAIDRLRRGTVIVSGRQVQSIAVDALDSTRRASRFALLNGSIEPVFQQGENRYVLISEPLARRERIWTGDTITVTGSNGTRPYQIAGVYYEYGNESGTVVMNLTASTSNRADAGVQGVAIYLRSPENADVFIANLRQEFASLPIVIRSNGRIREEALRIFDQTFAITQLLQTMTLVIAIAGVTLTLLVLTKERVSELALYRALGGTPRQIFTVFLGKGLGLATFGFALGAVGGTLLALVLVYIINRAYFGWTIQLFAPWPQVTGQFAVVLVAASMASLYPAWKAAHTSATELSRENL